MAREAYIVGAYSTEFRKWPEKSFKDLTRDACLGVLQDAALEGRSEIDSVWFANSGMCAWGQASIRGQVCLAPLQREGLLRAGIPVINVENACAGGSAAVHAAWKDILSGQSNLSLAIGVEKLYFPGIEKEKVLEGFAAGIDNLDPTASCVPAGRSFFVNACAERARRHMLRYGTTPRQIAAACAKSHWYGARNVRAQYQFEVPIETVLRDRVVSAPLTRSMCAPPGDGSAAVLLCSGAMLRRLPLSVRKRAVVLAASVMGSGETAAVARKAYQLAGVQPCSIHVAELHDYTSFCEIEQAEALGFCEPGEGGAFAESGASGPEGVLPINTSGGLVSKSHPVGATGLAMLHELVLQLRQEAGTRQVPGARVALQQNCGGAVGSGDAVCSVTILRSTGAPSCRGFVGPIKRVSKPTEQKRSD